MKTKEILTWIFVLNIIPTVILILATIVNKSFKIGLMAFSLSWVAMLIIPFGIEIDKKNLIKQRPGVYKE